MAAKSRCRMARDSGSPQTLRGAIMEGRIPVTSLYERVLLAPAGVETYRARSQSEDVSKRGKPRKTDTP